MRVSGSLFPTWVVAAAVVALSAGPARAFYWYGPPQRTVLSPPDLDAPGSPPTPPSETPPIETPPIKTPPVVVPPPEWPPVEVTPEPATIFGALAGFGALAAARAWRGSRAGCAGRR